MCNPSPSGGFIENHHPSQPISDPSCIEVCWCHQRQWHCSLKQIGEIRRTGSALRQLGVSSTCQRPWHDCANRRSMGMLLQNPCYKIQIFWNFLISNVPPFLSMHRKTSCPQSEISHSTLFGNGSPWLVCPDIYQFFLVGAPLIFPKSILLPGLTFTSPCCHSCRSNIDPTIGFVGSNPWLVRKCDKTHQDTWHPAFIISFPKKTMMLLER
jgi:hypothetical protein